MITFGLLEMLVNFLLIPVDFIGFNVNWLLGIDWVVDIVQIIAFVLPWNNILPLIIGLFGLWTLKISIAIFSFFKGLL